MLKLRKSLGLKLVVSLFVGLGILMGFYTWYQCRDIRTRVEKDLEAKGLALAKAGALGLQALIENDIKNGTVSPEVLFNREYIPVTADTDPKTTKYKSAFDDYTDKHWQKYVDSFLVDNDIVFAIPVAYSEEPSLNGYLPTHNNIFRDRSKRIFNDATGAAAATNTNPAGLKQVYKRDTGETMWDMSYPIYIDGRHWGGFRVAVSILEAEVKIASAQKWIITMMAGILISISLMLFLIVSQMVGKPLGRILKAAENLVSGNADLTARLETGRTDEIGMLAEAFNRFIEKIHLMVKKVDESIELVTQTSDQLSDNAENVAESGQKVAEAVEHMARGTGNKLNVVTETREVMEQFTAAISQIATGAQEQSGHVNKTSAVVGEMAEAINNVTTGAEAVLAAAVDSASVARRGEDAVESTIAGMERIKNAVYESAVKIKELGDQSQKIGEIIQVIDDIAEQTNLLALNAAIEAARAGEHGKGFAVVADEVRKLAERSGRATKEIAELISSIQKGTGKAVTAMEQGTGEVEEGVRLAHEAGAALEGIMQTTEQVLARIESISEAAGQMSESSTSMVAAMDNVAAITEENSASTEQMAAGSDNAMASIEVIASLTKEGAEHAESISQSVEEMAAATEDIAKATEDLSAMAHQLQGLVKEFRI